MAAIPVDTVVAHLHGIAVESLIAPNGVPRDVGGGQAALDMVRTNEGIVRVSIMWNGRMVRIEIPHEEWPTAIRLAMSQP